jgi:thymidylate synthase (FAD)
MKLIESKAEYIPQEEGLDGIYKAIELAGRTAYHSQNKITPDSAKDFVDRMIKSKHGAALEHGTVYLKLPFSNLSVGATNTPKEKAQKLLNKYIDNKYTQVFAPDFYGDWLYATSNMRVLVENNRLDDLKYLCSPTEFHEKRYTMRFTCSRAIAQELTRHKLLCAA